MIINFSDVVEGFMPAMPVKRRRAMLASNPIEE
jgi:hypothetical protein